MADLYDGGGPHKAVLRFVTTVLVLAILGESVSEMHSPTEHVGRHFGPGTVFRDCPESCPEMVVVSGGTFKMGSSFVQADGSRQLERTVTIAPFAVSTFHVTIAEWDACVEQRLCSQAYDNGQGHGGRPVTNVSWYRAKAFVQWLSDRTGKAYRLLSEAEWEYLARGVMPEAGVAPVGSRRPNAFGVDDVAESIWEWVEDDWFPGYEGAPVDGSSRAGGEAGFGVLRGGSWRYGSAFDRIAFRRRAEKVGLDSDVGFRVARQLAPGER